MDQATALVASEPVAPSTVVHLPEGYLSSTFWTLKRVATFPARLFARVRLIDQLLEENAERQASAISARIEADRAAAAERSARLGPGPSGLPGPWSFFLSGYGIGIVVMTYLVTKIHSVVVPSHRLSSSSRRSPLWPFFPLDLHSTLFRTLVRLPTLFFLVRTLITWTVVLLQTADLYPSWLFLQNIGTRVQSVPTEDLHWSTFLVVCATLLVSAFTVSLESDASRRTSPFNLMGYAFLLHIYSSPLNHSNKAEGVASRPDKHAVVTIIMPLLQLTLLHFLGVKKSWSRNRLLPTAFCALVSLAHFHYVLWFSSSPYPVVTFLPSVLESLLVALVTSTIALSALAQIAADGRLTRPLLGHTSAWPSFDEDFAVALLRAGTASLDATSVAGLGNELAPVALPARVELDRTGATHVRRTGAGPKTGLASEVRQVKIAAAERDVWFDTVFYRELTLYALGLGRVLYKAAMWSWRLLTGRGEVVTFEDAVASYARATRQRREEREAHDMYVRFLRGEPVSDDSDDEYMPPVQRLRSPSVLSDGFESREATPAPGDAMTDAVDLYADHITDDAEGSSSGVQAPLLLAHLTASAASPLTRRRYANLLALPAPPAHPPQPLVSDDPLTQLVAEVRTDAPMSASAQDDLMRRQTCVVCACEPRSVLLWPCRCLALCDDCRANLASRASASKHTCPCCRQQVEGFSKIFIP